MKSKWIIFVVAIVALAALFYWSGQEGRSPEPHTMGSMEQMPSSAPHSQGTELPVITTAKVVVQGADGTNLGVADLDWQKLTPLEGTKYSLKITEFYTQWNWDQHAINLSREEANPAARIEVYEGSEMKYTGWAFKNVPFFRMTMHNQGEGNDSDRLAFTLMTYEGVTFPDGAGQGKQENPHKGAEG